MPDYSKYQWDTKHGSVKHGGKVAGVSLDTAILDAMVAGMDDKLSGIIEEVGDLTVVEVARNTPVDTGELKDSYLSESDMVEKLKYRIQDGVPYGIFNELGTSRMAARPHVVPAVEDAEKELTEAIKVMFE